LAILGEWDERGEVCWKWTVLLGLDLRFSMGFYALLQRTGISIPENNATRRAFISSPGYVRN
jgi:hypothetical protein